MNFPLIKNKLIEWLKRYLPAEIVAIFGAVIGGLIAHRLFANPIVTALAGTWGENVGYYGQILSVEIKKRKQKDGQISFIGSLKILRDIVLEFGAGEYLDSFVIRPAAMYFFPQAVGNVTLGLLLGKLSADVTFYIPTVISYELKKRYIKD